MLCACACTDTNTWTHTHREKETYMCTHIFTFINLIVVVGALIIELLLVSDTLGSMRSSFWYQAVQWKNIHKLTGKHIHYYCKFMRHIIHCNSPPLTSYSFTNMPVARLQIRLLFLVNLQITKLMLTLKLKIKLYFIHEL